MAITPVYNKKKMQVKYFPIHISKSRLFALCHFMSLSLFIPPEDIRKPKVFSCLQGGKKREQWLDMGNNDNSLNKKNSLHF